VGIYFSLETEVPPGGSLVLKLGSFDGDIGETCNVWPIDTTIDVNKYTLTNPNII